MRDTTPDLDVAVRDLIAHLHAQGCKPIETAVLLPAERILDLAGEELRRRLLVTTDAAGRDYVLRYDLTIPVVRAHIASALREPVTYATVGRVWRDRGEGSPEFLQGGVECFGREDRAAADAEMVALALECSTRYGLVAPVVKLGDVGLFTGFVRALHLPQADARRLFKAFDRNEPPGHAAAPSPEAPYRGVLAALEGAEPGAARALVTDLLTIAGLQPVGGRSVDEIADRFLKQATARPALAGEQRDLVERFLAIAGDPDEVAAAVRTLAEEAGLGLTAELDLFEERNGFLAARGVDLAEIRAETAFGRGLDYYTGLVFELYDRAGRELRPMVAGGRYDGLVGTLGGREPEPAVGFAVWIERLAALHEGDRA